MDRFLELHRGQLLGSQVPEHLWPALYEKLSKETFDAGEFFMLAVDEDDDLHAVVRDDCDVDCIQPQSSSAIFLVDHAWTFTIDTCRAQLEQMPALLARMEQLLRVNPENDENALDQRVSAVLDALWRVANTYRLGSPEMNQSAEAQAKNTAIWYVMDEFGSAIEHAMAQDENDAESTANVSMAPFFFHDNQTAFSLFWPKKPLEAGDFLTRDFVPRGMDHATRIAMLAALFFDPSVADNTPYVEQLEQVVAQRKREYSLEQAQANFAAVVGRDSEIANDLQAFKPVALDVSEPIKWYSNLSLMQDHLRHDKLQFVDNESDAQVVWPTWHIKDFVEYAQNDQVAIINQFPNEKVLTCKDLLYEMCCLANQGERPKWLAQTFNMASQLPELVHEYIQLARKQAQEQQESDELVVDENHWIVKPWNLARSIDTCIARNVAHLARLSQTGPKIACKYITNPVLIDERKFDCRFLVMLKSIEPLEVYVSGVYWARVANKPFSMDSMDDFEKHFTVMNYSQYQVRYMHTQEFEARFDSEYPTESWQQVKSQAFTCIRQLFELATRRRAPFGLGQCVKSRALYGIDVMFQWRDQPDPDTGSSIEATILEVNFQPDCTRACRFFPHFYQDLMQVLVLGDDQHVHHGVTKLDAPDAKSV